MAQIGAQKQAEAPGQSVSCDDVMLYETADAHPDIRWRSVRKGVPSGVALSCLLRTKADEVTIETVEYLSSGLYRFVRECQATERETYRLFEYKKKEVPYLLRLHSGSADPATYVVVLSTRTAAGNYQHMVSERVNSSRRIKRCPPEGTSPP
jgi:hypothetical protein